MELLDRYHLAIFDLLYKVRKTQREAITKAADIVKEAVISGHKVYLSSICHYIDGSCNCYNAVSFLCQ